NHHYRDCNSYKSTRFLLKHNCPKRVNHISNNIHHCYHHHSWNVLLLQKESKESQRKSLQIHPITKLLCLQQSKPIPI
ncbi:hypothetical protein C2G38_2094196, partial [Gigaspora rosea]